MAMHQTEVVTTSSHSQKAGSMITNFLSSAYNAIVRSNPGRLVLFLFNQVVSAGVVLAQFPGFPSCFSPIRVGHFGPISKVGCSGPILGVSPLGLP